MTEKFSCYLSVRIKNTDLANKIQTILEGQGIEVFNPCTIIPIDIPKKDLPREIANACYEMMDKSQCTVLIAGPGDDFGRDCATELGYTKASKKRLFILVNENINLNSARTTLQKEMLIHGKDFPDECYVNNIEILANMIKQRDQYLSPLQIVN